MIIGVPREVKPGEQRVALTPDGARELVSHEHRVLIERDAGAGSSITDDEFKSAGADLVGNSEVWEAELVLKVKEPQPQEFGFLRPDLIVFAFLHLAAYPAIADVLLASETTAFACELVTSPTGSFPLLAPMSEVAGRLAPQIGAHFLERGNGGRGVLLGGVSGVRPARVVVIGAGTVGSNAAWIAQGMEAEVFLIDKDTDRLRWVDQIHRGRIMTLNSNKGVLERTLGEADLLIGAVLLPGGRAPVVVTQELVEQMRPGSVIVDIAVDQGGCVETTVETTHDHPIVEKFGVLHYGVGNIPAAVPHTSTFALTNATFPYVSMLADLGARRAVTADAGIRSGLAVAGGRMTNSAVANALGRLAIHPDAAFDDRV
jgi:alanine dehydrogenase